MPFLYVCLQAYDTVKVLHSAIQSAWAGQKLVAPPCATVAKLLDDPFYHSTYKGFQKQLSGKERLVSGRDLWILNRKGFTLPKPLTLTCPLNLALSD